MMKKTILSLLGLLTGLLAVGQQNVIKVNPFNLVGRVATFSYERALNDRQSLAIQFGARIPWQVPTAVIDAFELPSELEVTEATLRGFNITPQYRFYLSSRKDAPAGFYVAPYLRYNRRILDTKLTATFEEDGISETGVINTLFKLNSLGLGAQLGVQWLIADLISIDWYFLGLSVNSYILGADLELVTDYDQFTLEDISAQIREKLSRVPIVGGTLESAVEDNQVSVRAGSLGVGFRTGLSIGVAF
jgi:hypothetical protein